MPLKRKRYGTTRYSYKKAKYSQPIPFKKTKYNKPIIPGSKQPIHYHKRVTALTSFQVMQDDYNNALDYKTEAYYFSLVQVPGYAELTAVYDQYRIKYINFKLRPRSIINNNANFSAQPAQQNLKLIAVIDYDSTTSSLTPGDARQYGTAREFDYNCQNDPRLNIFFTPASLIRGYEGVSTDAFLPKYWQWIDCNDPDTPHYGIHLVLNQYGNSLKFAREHVGCGYDISVTYHLEFKNSR